MEPMSVGSQLDCAICYGVLVDPVVVGACGHDFCRACITRWCESSRGPSSAPAGCPLCRSPLPPGAPSTFAICQRLKQLTEHLFPEEVSARRRQLADETHAAAAAALAQRTAAAAERSRDQRRRTLRVRRTLPRGSPPGSPLLAPPPVPSPPQHPSPLLHVASPVTPGSIYGPVASTPTPGSFPVRVSNWDPPEVTFTMGWYEPPPPERRTRKSGRVRAAAARAAM